MKGAGKKVFKNRRRGNDVERFKDQTLVLGDKLTSYPLALISSYRITLPHSTMIKACSFIWGILIKHIKEGGLRTRV